MKKLLFILSALMAVALFSSVQADPVTTPRTETSLLTDVATIKPGSSFWAVLHIKLKEGWHTYWANPGDSGTSPILDWTLPSGFSAGEIVYLPPERLPIGPLMDYGYHDDAYYLVPIKAPDLVNQNATIILMLKAQWLVCKDVCVPEKAELSAVLPVAPAGSEPRPSEDAALLEGLVKKLPVAISEPVAFEAKGGMVRFNVKLPAPLQGKPKSISFYPAVDGVISNLAKQEVRVKGDIVAFSIKQGDDTAAVKGSGVVSVIGSDDIRTDYAITLAKGAVATLDLPAAAAAPAEVPVRDSLEHLTLTGALLLALLGGLTLNLMPCVLPILSLKVLSVAKKAKKHASQVRKQALAYTFGVVLSFMLLAALLIGLQRLLGESLGWGFQLQSPVFVAFLSLLLFLVGLNLAGVFELPVLFGTLGGEKAAEDSAIGSFLTGVLAVMVATPCSAPFMAPAIGWALTQSAPVVLMVFAALGIGLASPFMLFSFAPGLANLLPRPGEWMLTLREFLSFPIFLTVVWLLWVLAGEAGADAMAMTLLAMVAAGFCIFLLYRESVLTKLLAMLLAVGIVYGLAHIIDPMPMGAAPKKEEHAVFSLQRLEELRAAGKPVLVDATADWCITCKVNETVALSRPEVKAAFGKQGITLLVADWTRGDTAITDYLQSFGRSGVPLYVYYPAGGGAPRLLPQLLTPALVLEAIGEAKHE